jgi:hypothetical protein
LVSDWSADSEWLLASRENAVSNHSEIWELPTANHQAKGRVRKIIACDPKNDLWQSRFSPDGHWIVFDPARCSSWISSGWPTIRHLPVSLSFRHAIGKFDHPRSCTGHKGIRIKSR